MSAPVDEAPRANDHPSMVAISPATSRAIAAMSTLPILANQEALVVRRLTFAETMRLLDFFAHDPWMMTFENVPASQFREHRDALRKELAPLLRVQATLARQESDFLTAVLENHPGELVKAGELLAMARKRLRVITSVLGFFAVVDVPDGLPVGGPMPPPGIDLSAGEASIEEVYRWMAPSEERRANARATRDARFEASLKSVIRDHGKALDLLANR